MHPIYAQTAAESKVLPVAYVDDFRVMGSPEQLTDALTIFSRLVGAAGLTLNLSKSSIYWPHRRVPETIAPFERLGVTLKREGIEVLGSYHGLSERESFQKQVDTTLDALLPLVDSGLSSQEHYALLRGSFAAKIAHLLRTSTHPCLDSLQKWDRYVENVALRFMEAPALAPHERTQLRLPLRLGGCGLRSAYTTAPLALAASIAGVEPLLRFALENTPFIARLNTSLELMLRQPLRNLASYDTDFSDPVMFREKCPQLQNFSRQ
eukprot:Pompholyxophrys_punicea_v1_NODE_188_length_2887_cov_6.109463.p3 type:complete len:265 gc:universal NODE_188_length_2887_cov_6.109463:1725-931(-)